MAKVIERERCKGCGFKVRSAGHEKGPHHLPPGPRTKTGKAIHKAGQFRPAEQHKTAKKSAGHGFDFKAVKRGGIPGARY